MSAPKSSVTRTVDTTGDEIKSFQDGLTVPGAREVQGMALDPEIQGCLLTNGVTNGTAVDQETVTATAGALLFRADAILTDPAPSGDRWLMVFDKAGAAINTDLPILRSPKLVGGFASIDLGVYGIQATLGLVVALSTTPDALTLSTVGDGFFQYAYSLPST